MTRSLSRVAQLRHRDHAKNHRTHKHRALQRDGSKRRKMHEQLLIVVIETLSISIIARATIKQRDASKWCILSAKNRHNQRLWKSRSSPRC